MNKHGKIVYFMAEASCLMISILLMFTLLNHYWLNWELLDGSFIAFLIPIVMMFYTYIRYIFSGIEHTGIVNEKRYTKQRRVNMRKALLFGFIFLIACLVVKGIPSNWTKVMDIIGPAIFSMIFYYTFDLISLKRSYRKSREFKND